ncbi:NAD(P)/FAD-dependent oxidoreductase [Pedobacter rhizosphaerae]|uniref:Predicted NAD/FAD-binding protein n=1 Tax=Pedobacter rhizosphaerae TaxID=390241 RepID=A0A1H9PV20_9SPHI|nr:FAD-dependent oxidoreductase [Pedobacter rhizosphaerae]SER51675.1 Predicted NAD/FAD-binding protein [Pedobacter rhizosphaerae]
MKKKLAIIGTGIAGMGSAHLLQHKYDITLFEALDYVGGHTNTITLEEEGKPIYLDSGFMVFNYQTYPNLCKLFQEIDAPIMKTDMSFSVQFLPKKLEYSGSSLNHLFAQRKNIFNISYLQMLMQINRFNKQSVEILDKPEYQHFSVGEFFKTFGYSEAMLWQYLIPMSAAVWSAPMEQILDFPAVTLIRFFKNHGFLGLNTQHQWYTLKNGSQAYREKLIEPFRDKIRLNTAISAVRRLGNGKVEVETKKGERIDFDAVIMACHADQTFEIVKDKTALEAELLSKFKYQLNKAVVHTDKKQMPQAKLAWSSWNYRVEQKDGKLLPSTIYWMNNLQGVSKKTNYFVSINPTSSIDQSKVIKEIDYHHPLFDVPAMQAQERLHQLNESGPVYYCGSYFKYGFHEDAYKSAVELSQKLLK